MISFRSLHRGFTPDMLGWIPLMLSEDDPRSAIEQLDANYQHGGGWTSVKKFRLLGDGSIQYPGDEPLPALAEANLRGETIRYYESSWVAVIQPDGSYDVARMD